MLTPTERQLIDDILRVAAIAPTVPTSYLTHVEYESRGGRFTGAAVAGLGLWTWYHAAARLRLRDPASFDNDQSEAWRSLLARKPPPDQRRRGGGKPRVSPSGDAPRDDDRRAQRIIDDVRRVCRCHGWPQGARPSFREYRRLGGRYAEVHIVPLGGWRAVCARAGLHALRKQLDRATADLATIAADARRVARSLGMGDGAATLTSQLYREFGGRYDQGALSRVGGWAAICVAAGLALPRRKDQRRRRKWRKSSGVWCGPAGPDAGLEAPATIAAPAAAAPAASPPAAGLNLPPKVGTLFVDGAIDRPLWQSREWRRAINYYRARRATIAHHTVSTASTGDAPS